MIVLDRMEMTWSHHRNTEKKEKKCKKNDTDRKGLYTFCTCTLYIYDFYRNPLHNNEAPFLLGN